MYKQIPTLIFWADPVQNTPGSTLRTDKIFEGNRKEIPLLSCEVNVQVRQNFNLLNQVYQN